MKQKRKNQAHFDSNHGTRSHTSISAGKNVPDMYAKQREKQVAGIGLDRRCHDARSAKAGIGEHQRLEFPIRQALRQSGSSWRFAIVTFLATVVFCAVAIWVVALGPW